MQLLEGLFQPRQQVVEYSREVSEFVIYRSGREALVEKPRRNALGLLGHSFHGLRARRASQYPTKPAIASTKGNASADAAASSSMRVQIASSL